MTRRPMIQLEIPTYEAPAEPERQTTRDYQFAQSLVTLFDPFQASAEAMRAMRTHIMAQHVDEGRRALAICAASPGVGCSFVASNLAVALSQIGVKTLLMDGDLRQPSIHRIIHPPQETVGLSECLGSPENDFGAYVAHDVLPNLSVMYAGASGEHPQELLASDRFNALMDYCLRDFDATIIDTPPANSCSDARRICTVAGYGLVVARRHHSLVDDVKTLGEQFHADHARIIGTVLNEG